MLKIFTLFSSILISIVSNAQIGRHNDSTDLTFKGTRVNPYSIEYDTTGKIIFSGYIDTYYAEYTDTAGANGYQKFPLLHQDQINLD